MAGPDPVGKPRTHQELSNYVTALGHAGYAKEIVSRWRWLCFIGLAAALLPLVVRAQGQPRQSSTDHKISANPSLQPGKTSAQTTPGAGTVLFATRHQVALPAGDPRRLRLPLVKAGTLVELDVQPAVGTDATRLHSVELELLRDDRTPESQHSARGMRSTALQPVLRSTGPWQSPLQYRAPWDGQYLVVLRQTNGQRRTINLVVSAKLYRASNSPSEPYMLNTATRVAVAVFSGGLLWTTLLLCGLPIIRAFRLRRRLPEPPWYA